ncbi:VTT domain-containing protein [Undibacterium sp. Ren11W]|uniref:VTT domain-containing protein n=1 Tax=Undibacterium sp. Ren11W TaxID=3413045 RepID=UPI003BF26820
MFSTWLSHFMQQDSSVLVFMNVFLQQLGLPLPSVPTMILAASRASDWQSIALMLVAATLASLLADCLWYQAGRRFGYRVLSLLCKLSINPSSCVNQTEARFSKWGVWSLIFGKFIPGFSTVAPPVAGALGMRRSSFFIASAIGAALWSGFALLAGYALQRHIAIALELMSQHGIHLALLGLALIALVIAWKLVMKYRFERIASMHHVDAQEMRLALAGPRPPHIIDLRSASLIEQTGSIAHAHRTDYDAISASLNDVDKDYPIITICACPQDAGAVQVAHSLQKLGYRNAHPLLGGFDTWKIMAADDASLLRIPPHPDAILNQT